MNPITIQQLRRFGVTARTKKKLLFAFSTRAKADAVALSEALDALGYGQIEVYKQGARFTIEGWTRKVTIAKATIDSWVRQMCELGIAHQCLFEGWSTSSEA